MLRAGTVKPKASSSVGLYMLLLIALASVSASTVGITFNIESMTGQLMSGWSLSYGMNSTDMCSTSSRSTTTSFHEGSGCILQVGNEEQFSVVGTNEDKDFQAINIVGYASDQSGSRDLTTFFGKRVDLEVILRTLGIEFDQKLGVIVVGIDISTDGSNNPQTLTAAVGASAAIDTNSSPGFIYAPRPTLGQNIQEKGSSFVTFANVAVGKSTVRVKPPHGMSCDLGPAGTGSGESVEVAVESDTVTVVSYICH